MLRILPDIVNSKKRTRAGLKPFQDMFANRRSRGRKKHAFFIWESVTSIVGCRGLAQLGSGTGLVIVGPTKV